MGRGDGMPSGNEVRRKIIDYLLEKVDNGNGVSYLKAKHIASELSLTPKEVGANLGILQKQNGELPFRIVKWGYSKSTTWKVEWIR